MNTFGGDTLARPIFMDLLRLERKRAERSGRPLVLMLVEAPNLLKIGERTGAAEEIHHALARSTRETDIRGWYRDRSVIGVIFTEFGLAGASALKILSGKVKSALRESVGSERAAGVALSVHVFPDDCAGDS
jgi:hypothetical protein